MLKGSRLRVAKGKTSVYGEGHAGHTAAAVGEAFMSPEGWALMGGVLKFSHFVQGKCYKGGHLTGFFEQPYQRLAPQCGTE